MIKECVVGTQSLRDGSPSFIAPIHSHEPFMPSKAGTGKPALVRSA